MNRPTHDEQGIAYAEVAARRATCLRRAVGCCLTNDRNQVIATGYNGRATGLPHCNEVKFLDTIIDRGALGVGTHKWPNACAGATAPSGANLDACEAIHAEQNALLQCRNVYEINTCYVTVSPCVTCTKLLLNTSCRRIVFRHPYAHDKQARALWEGAGREWIIYSPVDQQ